MHPRSSAFSGLARLSRLAADRKKNPSVFAPPPLPMIRFGFTPLAYYTPYPNHKNYKT